MITTADVIRHPVRHPVEFPYHCGACGGPVLEVRGRLVPTWVHARHRDWLRSPHAADPLRY